jgi:hypothetical protein
MTSFLKLDFKFDEMSNKEVISLHSKMCKASSFEIGLLYLHFSIISFNLSSLIEIETSVFKLIIIINQVIYFNFFNLHRNHHIFYR